MQKKTMCGTFLAAMAIVAHGVALLEADGLVAEKSAGWRFVASGAKGGAAFNPLEGWYPDLSQSTFAFRRELSRAPSLLRQSSTTRRLATGRMMLQRRRN